MIFILYFLIKGSQQLICSGCQI